MTGALSGLFPGTAGNVIYSDGAGGVANEDAFTYAAATNTLNVDNITATTNLGLQTGGDHLVLGGGATASELRFLEPSASGTNYTAFKAQAQAGDVTYTLPAADGSAGAPLTTNGSGALAWGGLDWDTAWTDAAHSHQSAGEGGTLDHGLALTGLSDDDHTQYVLNDGTRATTILAAASADYVRIGGGATASELRFLEPSGGGTSYTGFKAPALAGNVLYTLPTADAAVSGYVLASNAAGTLSWAAAGAGSDAAPMTPQGRLTLTTATPVMVAEAAAQTTIYYTPYVGSLVPIYSGTWANTQFTELSIAMAADADWAADSNFDLFIYDDGGTLRLVTGAAWTNGTTRAEALVRTNGIWLNSPAITGRYSGTQTVSIAASRATYVGTFRTTAATGTTTWELGGSAAGGDPGKLNLWNCYNRVGVVVVVKDSTDSWTYATAAWRAADNSTTNACSFVYGLSEDDFYADVRIPYAAGAGTDIPYVGIGYDSTTTLAAETIGTFNYSGVSGYATSGAAWTKRDCIGYHTVTAIEYDHTVGTNFTGIGDNGGTILVSGTQFGGQF